MRGREAERQKARRASGLVAEAIAVGFPASVPEACCLSGPTRAAEIRAEIGTCEVCVGGYDSGVWIPLVPTTTFAEVWTLDQPWP